MWPLILKDFRRRWRSPVATLVMLVFPLFMSLALGSLIGNSGGGDEFPALRILVENRDENGFLSNFLAGSLGQGEAAEKLDATFVEPGEGEAMMEKGKASALLIIPENFSKDVLERRPTHLTVVRNPAEGIYPEVAVQGARVLSTYLDQGALLLGDDLLVIQDMIEANHLPEAAQVGAIAAQIMVKVKGVKRYLMPPVVTVHSTKPKKEEGVASFSIIAYILVMTTVMAVLFVAVRSINDLFEEEKNGMLRRQAASPLPLSRIIGAKLFFGVLLGIVVAAILAGIGLALGWIELPVDLFAAALVTIGFSAASCGVVAVLFALSRNEKQAGILSWLVIMGMSAVGGSLVPVEVMPAAMRSMSPFTLNYWAIHAYKQILFGGANTAGVSRDILALAVIAIVTLGVSGLLLGRRFREMRP